MDGIVIPIALRAGVVWRHKLPNYMVVFHVYGEKPHLRWVAPLPKPQRIKKSKRKAVRKLGRSPQDVCPTNVNERNCR